MAKVQPSKTVNMGDPPCCNVGGCALSKTCLWDVRQKEKGPVCWYFPRPFCLLLACLANLFLAPFAFALGWLRIYVIPCLLTTLHMMLSKFCCKILRCGKSLPEVPGHVVPGERRVHRV